MSEEHRTWSSCTSGSHAFSFLGFLSAALVVLTRNSSHVERLHKAARTSTKKLEDPKVVLRKLKFTPSLSETNRDTQRSLCKKAFIIKTHLKRRFHQFKLFQIQQVQWKIPDTRRADLVGQHVAMSFEVKGQPLRIQTTSFPQAGQLTPSCCPLNWTAHLCESIESILVLMFVESLREQMENHSLQSQSQQAADEVISFP